MGAIGIVGGVGPSAGLDLANKVFLHTMANCDQEHINLFLTSCPSIIPDRTEYLLNNGENPAKGIEKCIKTLATCGATAVGVSCNTAHSPRILSQVEVPQGVRFVNMIESCLRHVKESFCEGAAPIGERCGIGLLGTLGTIKTGVYADYFKNYPEMELIVPNSELCDEIHRAIYDKEYGIKATSSVSEKAKNTVCKGVEYLKKEGCKAVILGCTELPLVFPKQKTYQGIVLIDPTEVLAMELIKAVEPGKLKV